MTPDDGRSLTVQQLAERWQRRPQWVTQAARQGKIPGAWKLGHLWRFRLEEIEAYERAQQAQQAPKGSPEKDQENVFALAPGAEARRQNREKRADGLHLT